MTFAALFLAFVVAAYLRARRWRGGLWGILVAGAAAPIAVFIETYLYPAVPEARVWWEVATTVSLASGLFAAVLGHALAVFGLRRRDA